MAVLLGHQANLLPDEHPLGRDIEAKDLPATASWTDKTQKRFEKSCFSSTVWTE
jgi:hypothetical protein